jgi:hypothetical protein
MGNFDAYAIPKRDDRPLRSVLRRDIGPDAANTPEDLHIITRTLASAGLLDETANPALTHETIFRAIRHARKTLTLPEAGHDEAACMSPGDDTERAVRRALAKGRLTLSHRAVLDSTAPKGARSVIDGGMQRARAKLEDEARAEGLDSPLRRALLPVISAETFQSNRRLAEALATGGHIPGLQHIVANTVTDGGKQGYSDVRDFFQVLKSENPGLAYDLFKRTTGCLGGKALRRFRKLYFARPPVEGDFDTS